MASACRSNKFDVVNLTERGLEVEEVNAVDVVQEIVEITEWAIRKKGVTRTQATKTVMLAATSWSPILVERDARLDFFRDRKKCNMIFLGADVKRPLASVSAIVDEGNIVLLEPQESYIENTSTGQRIPTIRRQGVFVVQLDARGTITTKTVKFDEPKTDSVFTASVKQDTE